MRTDHGKASDASERSTLATLEAHEGIEDFLRQDGGVTAAALVVLGALTVTLAGAAALINLT